MSVPIHSTKCHSQWRHHEQYFVNMYAITCTTGSWIDFLCQRCLCVYSSDMLLLSSWLLLRATQASFRHGSLLLVRFFLTANGCICQSYPALMMSLFFSSLELEDSNSNLFLSLQLTMATITPFLVAKASKPLKRYNPDKNQDRQTHKCTDKMILLIIDIHADEQNEMI